MCLSHSLLTEFTAYLQWIIGFIYVSNMGSHGPNRLNRMALINTNWPSQALLYKSIDYSAGKQYSKACI